MSKTKPRQYGTGSVSQRATDGLWIGAIMAGWTAEGKRRRVIVTAKTETACIKALERKKAELARTGVPMVGTARKSVKAWAEEWLALTVSKVRPKTYDGYASSTKMWIIPTIGHRRLEFVTPDDIRAVSAAVRRPAPGYPTGRGAAAARHAHTTLMLMLKGAALEGHTVPQRLFFMGAPALETSDRDAMTPEDTALILAEASRLDDGSRWFAALLQGMRQGEILGLTWDLVDFDAHIIDVSWQLQAIPYRHGCGPKDAAGRHPCRHRFGGDCPQRSFRVPDGYEMRHLVNALHLVRPKTAKGRRILPMVPWLVAALRQWQAVGAWSPYGLVWPAADGRPRDTADDGDEWRALQCMAGTGHPGGRYWHLHEARHATATRLLEAGIDADTIKAILGHASIASGEAYKHVSQVLARKAMDAVAARLELPA